MATKNKKIYITIDEFIKNGGILKEGRKLYDYYGSEIGEYIKHFSDEKVDYHIGKFSGFKSAPISIVTTYVMVETIVNYI